ncbi:MAG TPA: 2-C-methyl-D-erythritol 4-phosphate cytidylyltransferase [Pyrinomonadaceae bacterium]|jgi:2-C-methyl-D-erythritol 4-phosphate cytidylyltransferase|nr:2-C-methyl-D-erythritol 4-phosphate cytidylyltransferase [Pyrinomonadaceae bacterium]
MNTAIIVAAGSGKRFKSDKPKQFVEIHGKPLIFHTLEKFQAAKSIDSVILVLPEDQIEYFNAIGSRFPISKLFGVVAGGVTRAESARNGLDAVSVGTEVVAVHDGARPLVTSDEIDATVEKAKTAGAACLVAPVTDTIKSVRGEEIANTLDREKLRRALTPQAFQVDVLRRAFGLGDLSEEVTDECYLVERLGHPIAFVEGSPRNIKITHSDDLIIAGVFLR